MIFKAVASILMMILFTTGFFGLDNLLRGRRFRDVSCAFDGKITLSPRWIWAYLLYYPVCFAPLFFPGVLTHNELFLRVAAGFFAQFLVAWALFYFFPTRMARVPVPGDSWSSRAVRGLYAVDPGYNIFPSLHVANSFYVAALSAHLMPDEWAGGFYVVALLISASTVLVKQHYLADIPSGMLLGLACAEAVFA